MIKEKVMLITPTEIARVFSLYYNAVVAVFTASEVQEIMAKKAKAEFYANLQFMNYIFFLLKDKNELNRLCKELQTNKYIAFYRGKMIND